MEAACARESAILSHVPFVRAISWSSSLSCSRQRYRGVHPFLGLLLANDAAVMLSMVYWNRESLWSNCRDSQTVHSAYLFSRLNAHLLEEDKELFRKINSRESILFFFYNKLRSVQLFLTDVTLRYATRKTSPGFLQGCPIHNS